MEGGMNRQNKTWSGNPTAMLQIDCHTLRRNSVTLVCYDYYGVPVHKTRILYSEYDMLVDAASVRYLIQSGPVRQ